jgi:hypothetical protein
MTTKFAFTDVAMAAALEDTTVSYEELADMEKDFDDVETEISMLYLSLLPLFRGDCVYCMERNGKLGTCVL